MSDALDYGPVEITRVEGKPRWRLAYCSTCSDGYRGGKVAAENWALLHAANWHGVTP